MAKNWDKLYADYVRENLKVRENLNIPYSRSTKPMSKEEFKRSFPGYKELQKTREEIAYRGKSTEYTNKQLAERMARDDLFVKDSISVEAIKKEYKNRFNVDLNYRDLAMNTNIDQDGKGTYDRAIVEIWKSQHSKGMTNDEWLVWSAHYLFGSE